MKKEEFCDVLGDINESYVEEARAGRTIKKPVWIKWGAIAACLCVVISLSVIILHQDEPELLTTEGHLGIINVELVEWQSDGFKAIPHCG